MRPSWAREVDLVTDVGRHQGSARSQVAGGSAVECSSYHSAWRPVPEPAPCRTSMRLMSSTGLGMRSPWFIVVQMPASRGFALGRSRGEPHG